MTIIDLFCGSTAEDEGQRQISRYARDGSPTLQGADGNARRFHPLVNYGAGLEFGLGCVIMVFHSFDAALHFEEIESFDGDARVPDPFFAVTDGVEGGGTGTFSALGIPR